jgi:eukaryotic-like serine/threonine-protein kinase
VIGQTISHYRITEKLGEGGMGVVYKAEDTKLERTVALKFLASHLLNDNGAKARFLREAKAAAALHHPNICTVHEIDEADGKTFLAMAFLKGETLEDRIAQGPLSLKDALDIGRQVADGLEAAHEKGIVHRDIKPANILIDAKGRATIMDFGLARLTEASRLTKADTTMGTVAYMSPEQAQGMEVDHRSDIWALGCVLYEMVCGQRPFRGQYDQALFYEIVHQEPEPLTGVRAGVPMELEFIVGKCLAKDRDDRTASAQEVARELRTLGDKLKSGRSTILRTTNPGASVLATVTAGQTVNPVEALPPDAMIVRRSSQRALRVLAVVTTVTLLALAFVHFTERSTEPIAKPVRRFSFAVEGLGPEGAIISPDGKYILYLAQTNGKKGLWLRSLSNESVREIAVTAGASAGIVEAAFWSPDSSSIGFAAGQPDYELRRVSIDGGDPITLCELPSKQQSTAFFGGTWSPDGERIVFGSGMRLYELPARGGRPRLLLDQSDSPRPYALGPEFLPAGSGPPALVYSTSAGYTSEHWVAVLNLETGEHRELCPGDRPVYSRDSYLIHGPASIDEPGLWALPFSLATLQPAGEDFPISTAGIGATVSQEGTLVYGDEIGYTADRTLTWRDRTGKVLETVGQTQPMDQVALSPDGRRVAVRSTESGNQDIWVHDLVRSTKTRLTFEEGPDVQPGWSPSGREVVYLAGRRRRLMRKAADGTGEAVVLVESESPLGQPNWSRDGRYLIYSENGSETQRDIPYLESHADGQASEPITFLNTPANEWFPMFSPDGRFVAYVSNESGRQEVYVRRFPDGAGK